MQLEYDSYLAYQTWSLTSLPPHKKPLGCKWFFKVKENLGGPINKYKEKLVAKGYYPQFGFDFNETFSPVVKPTISFVILALSLTNKWELQPVGVNNVFLNGSLQRGYLH